MDGDLRDVRTSPESPALWPDELSNPVLSLLTPLTFPFFIHLAGNGLNRPFHPPFFVGYGLWAMGYSVYLGTCMSLLLDLFYGLLVLGYLLWADR